MTTVVVERGQVVGLDAYPSRCLHPEKLDATRAQLLSLEEAGELSDVFRLLADPTRARILYALLEAGELWVCDLAATVAVAETSVSQALWLLRTAGIVRNRREGRLIYYPLDDAHVRLLLDVSREHLAHRQG